MYLRLNFSLRIYLRFKGLSPFHHHERLSGRDPLPTDSPLHRNIGTSEEHRSLDQGQ